MELSDTLKIQVSQYLNGELNEKELTEFEALLAQNEKLSQQVDLYKDLDDTMIASAQSEKDYAQINDLLSDLGDEYIIADNNKMEDATNHLKHNKQTTLNNSKPIEPANATGKSSKSVIRYLIPVATVAAAAILLFPILFPGDVDLKNLANNNYETYMANFTTKSETTDLSDAEKLYNKKEWEKAITKFNQYPDNVKAQIAKGNCEYQLKQYDKAISTLTPIVDNGDYGASASWYLALTYLQKENKTEATISLNKAKVDKRYESKANKLLKQLK